MKKIFYTPHFFLFVLLSFYCHEPENPVFQYLKCSELQYEGNIQKNNIKRALIDIITLPGDELKNMKYSDYRSVPNQWDLPTLLYRHFVPDRKDKSLGNNFYQDIKAKEVQFLIRKLLENL